MIGAVIGDVIGSVHEFAKSPTKTKDFPLFVDDSHYTDDTVCTAAIAEWLMSDRSKGPDFYLKKYVRTYPRRGYGGMFRKWAHMDESKAYNSWGNGSAMRVSACGWVGKNGKEVTQLAAQSSAVTHNHEYAIKGAQATAIAIYLARSGRDKDTIRKMIRQAFKYPLDKTVDDIRPTYKFFVDAERTVPPAIICALEADSFEDAIRNAISLGGDADTLAAIASSIAEPLYGIPDELIEKSLQRLPDHLQGVLVDFADYVSDLHAVK